MATFKAEVQAHQMRKDGTFNVKIRVTHNRRKKYLSTQYYVSKSELTRSGKIKNQVVVDGLERTIREWRDRCNLVGEGLACLSVEQVVEIIRRGGDENKWDLDFVAYGRQKVEEMMAEGRTATANAYKGALSKLCLFLGRDSVSILDITAPLLRSFVKWSMERASQLTQSTKGGAHGVKASLLKLNTLYSQAKKEYNDEEAGFVPLPFSPFARVEFSPPPSIRKRALRIEDMRAIAALPDSGKAKARIDMARDAFLISFSLMGMNAVDMFEAVDYRDGRITYERQKTRGRRADKALISVKVEPDVAALIEKYRDPKGERVFVWHRRFSDIRSFNYMLSLGIRRVGEALGIEGLTFYAARHTWATLAVNEVGIDKYTVHACLNHVDPATAITDVYIKKDWGVNDRANRAVLDYVFGSRN